jgi:hypothetical protein
MRVPKLSAQQDNCTEQPRNESREAILTSLMGLSGRLLSAGKARLLTLIRFTGDRRVAKLSMVLVYPALEVGTGVAEVGRRSFAVGVAVQAVLARALGTTTEEVRAE